MTNLNVSLSPHIHNKTSTSKIMLDVIIALIPAIIASGIIFGLRAILLIAVTVAACVMSEYITRKILKRDNTLRDLTAVITGILLALNLPVTLPLWMAALGGVIAIVVVKQFFGGLGQNFVNPAITARIVLLMSFSSQMSEWIQPFYYTNAHDAITSASYLAGGEGGEIPSLLNMFLGVRGGSLGETCGLALLLGGIYLVVRKVISPLIPVVFIGTVAVLSFVLGGDPLYQVLAGGLLLGAIFMATDYTTSPLTTNGKIIFAFGCGVITIAIRFFAALPEGVSYAILLMNILVPLIERLTIPKTFGQEEVNGHEG